MRPIGLTFKNVEYNPFTGRTSGELMVVHMCLNCSKISCNRIAGDDNSESIISLLEESGKFSSKVASYSISLLSTANKRQVSDVLFGYGR